MYYMQYNKNLYCITSCYHLLVLGADMRTLINMGYSIAERDADQKTARDIAEVAGITDNVQAIGWYICIHVYTFSHL